MGIEPHYIHIRVYGLEVWVWGRICGVLRLVIMVVEVWVEIGQWRFRVFRIRTATLSDAANPRTQPVKIVDDDCSYTEPRSLYGCHCEDIVCLTIRYHENDGSDAVTDSKTSLKTLHQDTDKPLHLLREFRCRNNRLWTGDCRRS